MCGIIGCVGIEDACQILYDGLERLEYRGYDSAGIAVSTTDQLHTTKVAGRVQGLATEDLPKTARTGLAHTRWATHGPPTQANAHPHLSCDQDIAVAHNGILTNHTQLRRQLEARGHTFTSDTDTEVVAHLLEEAYDELGGHLPSALQAVADKLEGSYAIIAAHAEAPGTLVAIRHQSPLVLGVTDDPARQGLFLASDIVAFRKHTDQVVYLEDGDLATITADGTYEIVREGTSFTADQIQPETVTWDLEAASKSGFPHFMLKEIHEQPRALTEAIAGRTTPGQLDIEGDLSLHQAATKEELLFIACGSSYNAAMAAAHTFQRLLGHPARVELASEFTPLPSQARHTLVVAVTQSGETADTLEALHLAKEAGFTTLAITNVVGSTITREAHGWIPIRAGPEISVAATKSFTSQLMVLHLLALHLAHLKRTALESEIEAEMAALQRVPSLARGLLDQAATAKALGKRLARTGHERAFILGRGQGHAIALETALKIKEISYIHAEGIAAGELKHGPLALIEDGTPVLAFTADGDTRDAMVSSMEEVAARGAMVIAITDADDHISDHGFEVLPIPAIHERTYSYLATIAGQLVAYEAAVQRGTDVDKPRNLAKSVTVG